MLKREATFFNNIAISFFVGGLVLPSILIMQKANSIGPEDFLNLQAMIYGLATIAAIGLSYYFHRSARGLLEFIED
jgi:hypothetical protein